jgi:Flp pilus assembly pilin Flp
MVHLLHQWMPPLERDEGQGMVEYALILTFVALVVIVVLTLMGNTLTKTFSNVSAAI